MFTTGFAVELLTGVGTVELATAVTFFAGVDTVELATDVAFLTSVGEIVFVALTGLGAVTFVELDEVVLVLGTVFEVALVVPVALTFGVVVLLTVAFVGFDAVELAVTFAVVFAGIVVLTCAVMLDLISVTGAGALTVVLVMLAVTTIGKDHLKSPAVVSSKFPL